MEFRSLQVRVRFAALPSLKQWSSAEHQSDAYDAELPKNQHKTPPIHLWPKQAVMGHRRHTGNITTSQHHNITTSQHHNITTSQHHNITTGGLSWSLPHG
jgi:hypothetical protein